MIHENFLKIFVISLRSSEWNEVVRFQPYPGWDAFNAHT